ncbi:hypothetical protein QML32_31155, partial [Klebsiella pneumoniae]|uniref:hypothetical protein n=1 Tax=Klebsiella pneumoniae TaxID=573 RepID=UPI003A812352
SRLNLTIRAVGNQPVAAPMGGDFGRTKVPTPRHFTGARDAKELENFLFDMEQYFRVTQAEEEGKVMKATMYMSGDAKLWWRTKYEEIQQGRCMITTWEDLKRELRT